jgi:hypothetical protein
VLAEVFNLFNSKNPGGFVANMQAANFGQPTTFAGDFQVGSSEWVSLGFASSSSLGS